MKILLLTREYPPLIGGIAMMTKNLAEEWVSLGHQVDVVTGCYKSAPRFEVANGVNVWRVDTFTKKDQTNVISAVSYIFFGFLKAFSLQRKNSYDVVNSYFAILGGVIGAAISKLFGIKNLLMIIAGDIYEPTRKLSPHNNPILRTIVTWVLNSADIIISPSSNVKQSAEKYYQSKKEIRVIPIGFKKPDFDPKSRSELNLDSDKVYFITVGRLAERKNFPSLISAFSKMNNRESELILIGDGPTRKELQDLAQTLGINHRVHFLGALSDEEKFQYLSVADIFVLPSWHEGFGIVFEEAMYCSLPIIASSEGGQVEFLKDNQNALLFKPHDIVSLTRAMDKLLVDLDMRMKFSMENKEIVKNFYIEKIAEDYIGMMR